MSRSILLQPLANNDVAKATFLAASFLLAVWFTLYRNYRRSTKYRLHDRKQVSAESRLDTLLQIGHQSGFAHQIAYLRRVDPFVFEEIVLSALRRRGYPIERSTKYTGDGGIDGKCRVNGRIYYLQMKRYTDHISREDLAAFVVKCIDDGVLGYFVHTGKTGSNCFSLCHDTVEIVSGQKLLQFLGVFVPKNP